MLSLLRLTLFVQVAHLSIRAVFVRAAVCDSHTEVRTPDDIWGFWFFLDNLKITIGYKTSFASNVLSFSAIKLLLRNFDFSVFSRYPSSSLKDLIFCHFCPFNQQTFYILEENADKNHRRMCFCDSGQFWTFAYALSEILFIFLNPLPLIFPSKAWNPCGQLWSRNVNRDQKELWRENTIRDGGSTAL